MAKIIIVNYSLEIVIAIINYNYHNLHWMMFIPLFEATTCYILDEKQAKKTLKNLYCFSIVAYKPQIWTIHWIGFFFKYKSKNMHAIIILY